MEFVKQFYPDMQTTFKKPDGAFEFRLNSGIFSQTILAAQEQFISGGAIFAREEYANRVSIEIPVIGHARMSDGGETVEAASNRSLIVTSPGRRISVEDDGLKYRCLMLFFDLDCIKRRFRVLTGNELTKPLKFELGVDVTQSAGKHFLQAALYPFMPSKYELGVFAQPSAAELYEDFLITAMLTCLPHNQSSELTKAASSNTPSSILARCEDHLQAHADDVVTISDVAESLGVSVRALQRSFQKAHGTTPMRRLKEIRLERARTRLLKADQSESVTDIALKSGFSSLGAFSVDYKRQFGEQPSKTIRKGKSKVRPL